MVSLKLSSQDINYNVNSHYYKNEMNPHFDLIEIVENHGIEGPKYGGYGLEEEAYDNPQYASPLRRQGNRHLLKYLRKVAPAWKTAEHPWDNST